MDARNVIYWLVHLVVLMFGVILLQANGAVVNAVGSSLVAAGIAGCVIFAYVRHSQNVADMLQALRDFGLKRIYAARGVRIKAEYDACLASASRKIDIMGFGLRAFLQDYHSSFPSWAAKAHVRVLLLDPEFPTSSPFSDQRDLEESSDVGTIAQDVRSFIARNASLIQREPERFQIRLYRCLPSVNIFRIDSSLFWGPYLVADQSRNMPTFVVTDGGILFQRLAAHFDTIWSSSTFSKPIPHEWLEAPSQE